MEPRPLEVKALCNYLLYIRFKNGEEKIYDMKENLKYPFYKNLKNEKNFKNVKVSGINIEWATGEDIAPENLYNDSESIANYSESDLIEL